MRKKHKYKHLIENKRWNKRCIHIHTSPYSLAHQIIIFKDFWICCRRSRCRHRHSHYSTFYVLGMLLKRVVSSTFKMFDFQFSNRSIQSFCCCLRHLLPLSAYKKIHETKWGTEPKARVKKSIVINILSYTIRQ